MLIDYSRRVFGPQIDTFHVHRLLLHTQRLYVTAKRKQRVIDRPSISKRLSGGKE